MAGSATYDRQLMAGGTVVDVDHVRLKISLIQIMLAVLMK